MKKIVALLIAASMMTASAHAAAIAKGTKELRLNGGINFESPYGTDFTLNLGYGYFIADYLQLGGLLGFSDNDLITSLALGGFVEYNFETETNIIPFVGSQLRYLYSDIDLGKGASNSALALGVYVGSKLFITDNLAISGRFLFEVATDDVYIEEKRANDVDYGIDFGLSYYF
ncbi:MAG TPA: outer membrane beta-barrel protein [Kiritimatiellia bacterium]|nr:outer membrane beta-barrel protein [Kiritimatiellia bacterium]HMO99201.1 outer membrane beta-barrel protein [Kiritimatiellia bacterium]HMP95788.1 outer membrane beta-barrel protein [Kiritimatiellia bacterium]